MCIGQSSYCFLLFGNIYAAPARHLQGRVTGGWYYRRAGAGAVFGYAMKNSVRLWLASRRGRQHSANTAVTK